MLYSQEQLDEINRQRELEELENLARNDPDTLVVTLPGGQEALIGKYADDYANGYKSAADFFQGRLNHYDGDLNELADEMNYDGVVPRPNHMDFILDLGNYGDDLLEFIENSYHCETLSSYLGIQG